MEEIKQELVNLLLENFTENELKEVIKLVENKLTEKSETKDRNIPIEDWVDNFKGINDSLSQKNKWDIS